MHMLYIYGVKLSCVKKERQVHVLTCCSCVFCSRVWQRPYLPPGSLLYPTGGPAAGGGQRLPRPGEGHCSPAWWVTLCGQVELPGYTVTIVDAGCPVVPHFPHFPHFQNFVHILKKFPHFPHFWETPLWKMATAAFWLRNVSYEGSNWRLSFALSVKHGFYFARTHSFSFSIEQQKATNNTWYMKNTIQSEHPQLI